MKNIVVVLFIFVSILSCTLESESDFIDESYVLLPIESVSIPVEMEVDQSYEIHLSYILPSNCHSFRNIYYSSESNERTVAIVSSIHDNSGGCETLNIELEESFNFKPNNIGVYIFNFWQGENEFGEDLYYTVEVEVM